MGVSLEQQVAMLLAQVAELRSLVLQSGDRPANPLNLRRGEWLGVLDGSLTAGGSATVTIYTWSITGSAWVSTGRTVTARDWFFNDDETAEAGTKVVVWWYVNTWVAKVVYCAVSDNTGAPE